MDYRKVSHFVAVVHSGSLTLAAQRLGVSQPALSKSLQALESSLGARLLERRRDGVTVTAAGEVLLARAQAAAAELGQAVLEINGQIETRNRSIAIGCGPSEATRLVGMALTRLRARHPELRLTVLYGLNEALIPMVKSGEVDFALSSVPVTATDPLLEHEVLHLDSAVVVARAGHPLAQRRSVKLAELGGYPWVLARRRELERRALDEIFFSAGLKPVEAEVETTSAVLMKTLVMQGDALTFLPREMIYWEERSGQLVALRTGPPMWVRHVGMTRLRSSEWRPAAQAFAEALRLAARGFGTRTRAEHTHGRPNMPVLPSERREPAARRTSVKPG